MRLRNVKNRKEKVISNPSRYRTEVLAHKALLRDKDNSIVFSALKHHEGYLVGGAVRDALMGRKSPDKDYIIRGNLRPVLKKICKLSNGKLIRIGKFDLYRIITSHNTILDFTPLSSDILSDLSARDFTVNAMAWSPQQRIIDPCSGLRDIKSKTIRIISAENLLKDPIRLLRAFRHAQELGFKIDAKTLREIKKLSHHIKNQKNERITLDFFRVLKGDNPLKMLAKMNSYGLLDQIIHINNKQFQLLYKRLIKIMSQYHETSLKVDFPDIAFGLGLNRREIIILELLLYGKRGFNLTITRKMRNHFQRFSAGIKLLQKEKRISNKVLFRLFETSEDCSPDVLISAGKAEYIHKYLEYLEVIRDPLAQGNTIMSTLKLKQGPEVGKIVNKARRALFLGTLKDKTDLKKLSD